MIKNSTKIFLHTFYRELRRSYKLFIFTTLLYAIYSYLYHSASKGVIRKAFGDFLVYANKANTNSGNRNIFRRFPLQAPRVPRAHSHGDTAAQRSAAMNDIKIMSTAMGKIPYYIQPRPCEITNGAPHTSGVYWSKDTTVTPRQDKIKDDHIITMCDSDYYEDMNYLLRNNNNQLLLYTFSPTKTASAITSNMSWTTCGTEVTVQVSGGAEYKHELWDYEKDIIRSAGYTCDLVGSCESIIRIATTIPKLITGQPADFADRITKLIPPINYKICDYLVETRTVSETHKVIYLEPLNVWTGFAAYLAYFTMESPLLSRKDFKSDIEGFSTQRVISSQSDQVSISRENEFSSVLIDTPTLEAIKSKQRRGKSSLSEPTTNGFLDRNNQTNITRAETTILVDYVHKCHEPNTKQYLKLYNVDYGVKHYTMFPEHATDDFKPSLVPYMFPIVNAAYAPTNSLSSSAAAINGRLNKQVKEVKMEQYHWFIMTSLIERLIPTESKTMEVRGNTVVFPKAHTAHIVEEDTVREHQNRPTQLNILDQAEIDTYSKTIISFFVKKESYAKIADPRIISIVKPATKLLMSKYAYAVAAFLKSMPWYVFGLKPYQIAERISAIAQSSESIGCYDYSRFDGNKTNIGKTFMYIFMKRLFAIEYHSEIDEMTKDMCNNKGFSRDFDDYISCVMYCTFCTQASGTPDTANANSLEDIAILFDSYYTQTGNLDVAFEMIMKKAQVGGDDNTNGDLTRAAIVKAAARWGHTVTGESIPRGQPGVNFLARIYSPDVWYGSLDSHTDIPRALAKLHTTTNLSKEMEPTEKFQQKLSSLYMTDRNTPVIRDILTIYIYVGGEILGVDQIKTGNGFGSHWSKFNGDVQYPNAVDDWAEIPENWQFKELHEYFDYVAINFDQNPNGLPQDELTQECIELLLRCPPIDAEVMEESKREVIVVVDGDPQLLEGTDGCNGTDNSVNNVVPPKLTKTNPLETIWVKTRNWLGVRNAIDERIPIAKIFKNRKGFNPTTKKRFNIRNPKTVSKGLILDALAIIKSNGYLDR